uniref:Uncharacterized LOC100187538 n=1 Tax=Ciona intestinalis TaxID=7719 RepID=F7APP7_CIOIN|nr:uncharacterized protein LOC100187538 [Ciona intestinalis]|eukprot:XP_002121637.1 uncharacterized protein LOC100187538 [Ciona intestinalis]
MHVIKLVRFTLVVGCILMSGVQSYENSERPLNAQLQYEDEPYFNSVDADVKYPENYLEELEEDILQQQKPTRFLNRDGAVKKRNHAEGTMTDLKGRYYRYGLHQLRNDWIQDMINGRYGKRVNTRSPVYDSVAYAPPSSNVDRELSDLSERFRNYLQWKQAYETLNRMYRSKEEQKPESSNSE